jgi:hypothetical protein
LVLPRAVQPPLFSAFALRSSFSNTGMTMCDALPAMLCGYHLCTAEHEKLY